MWKSCVGFTKSLSYNLIYYIIEFEAYYLLSRVKCKGLAHYSTLLRLLHYCHGQPPSLCLPSRIPFVPCLNPSVLPVLSSDHGWQSCLMDRELHLKLGYLKFLCCLHEHCLTCISVLTPALLPNFLRPQFSRQHNEDTFELFLWRSCLIPLLSYFSPHSITFCTAGTGAICVSSHLDLWTLSSTYLEHYFFPHFISLMLSLLLLSEQCWLLWMMKLWWILHSLGHWYHFISFDCLFSVYVLYWIINIIRTETMSLIFLFQPMLQ